MSYVIIAKFASGEQRKYYGIGIAGRDTAMDRAYDDDAKVVSVRVLP